MNYEGLIPFFGGIYATLCAFGFIQASKSKEKNAEWLKKYGVMLKICGPLCIIFGIVMFLNLLK